MKKMQTGCFLLAFVFCAAGLGVSNAQAQNYNLKIQTAVPSSSIYFKLIERMAGWSWAMRPMDLPPPWVLGLYYGGVFGILLLVHRRKVI